MSLPKVACPVCGAACRALLHKQVDGISITSDSSYTTLLSPWLARCEPCSLFLTAQQSNLHAFYAEAYSLLMSDFFADQVVLAQPPLLYRADYQARIALAAARAINAWRLTEVGAGKGLTAFRVRQALPALELSLHDPGAARYAGLWARHVAPQAAVSRLDEIKPGSFDLGVTFFTLEHTCTPYRDLQTIVASLGRASVFVGVVPDLAFNPGDLLVGDHCSHFTAASLQRMLGRLAREQAPLSVRVMRNPLLRGLFYVLGRLPGQVEAACSALAGIEGFTPDLAQGALDDDGLLQVALRHWDARPSGTALDGPGTDVLWGAGFYSKLIMLRHPERVFERCVDMNPQMAGTTLSGPTGRKVPVGAPTEWLAQVVPGTRLWLGVSSAAREAILRENEAALAACGVTAVL